MLNEAFNWAGRIYTLLWQVILTALLSVGVYLTWHFYQEQRLLRQLQNEGMRVTVQVERVDTAPRALWDALGNAFYLGFSYRNQSYETRWVIDSLRPGAGDRVVLLYHPQHHVFAQPPRASAPAQTRVVSRLINWVGSIPLDTETRALGLFVLVAVALFYVGGGLLAPLLGGAWLPVLARGVLLVGLGAGAAWSAYEALQYYRYVARLQRGGQPMEVTVLDTDRRTHGRKSGSRHYTYEATFRFNNQERVIAIEEADFARLSPANPRLSVRYDAELNDFVAEGYSAGFSQALPPLVFTLFLVLLLRSTLARPAPKPKAQPASE